MFKVFLSGHLKEFSGGRTEIELDAAPRTVGDALSSLWDEQGSLRDRILNEQGEIRQHVNIFYDGRDVKKLHGLSTAITKTEEIHIFNAVSGG
jgi:sulfur-carrier protein